MSGTPPSLSNVILRQFYPSAQSLPETLDVPHPVLLHYLPAPFPSFDPEFLYPDYDSFPVPGLRAWSPVDRPFVSLFLDVITALDSMAPPPPVLILLCFIWSTPDAQLRLVSEPRLVGNDWSAFCDAIADHFPHRALYSRADAFQAIARLFQYNRISDPDQATRETLYLRFEQAMNVSCVVPLNILLDTGPELLNTMRIAIRTHIEQAGAIVRSLHHYCLLLNTFIADVNRDANLLEASGTLEINEDPRARIREGAEQALRIMANLSARISEFDRFLDFAVSLYFTFENIRRRRHDPDLPTLAFTEPSIE